MFWRASGRWTCIAKGMASCTKVRMKYAISKIIFFDDSFSLCRHWEFSQGLLGLLWYEFPRMEICINNNFIRNVFFTYNCKVESENNHLLIELTPNSSYWLLVEQWNFNRARNSLIYPNDLEKIEISWNMIAHCRLTYRWVAMSSLSLVNLHNELKIN